MNHVTKLSASWLMLATIVVLAAACSRAPQGPQAFDTPEQAIAAMESLIGKKDRKAIERVFGPGAVELFDSGDPEADAEDFQRVKAMVAESVGFLEHDERTRVALLGNDEWPFPIPLVSEGGKWRFDTAAGREEILNRRIGHNELFALTALHEVVDAQREYASEGRDGNPPAFARRFRSSEGKRDGLFWPVGEGDPPSPLGDLLADSDTNLPSPSPFRGYYYRMLDRQGPGAFGGEQSYVDDKGQLIGGFAVVAWPAKYGISGVMTFIISHRGVVWQKDLGAETDKRARAIEAFDPDPSWVLTADELQVVKE
jgi:hypothetical protein